MTLAFLAYVPLALIPLWFMLGAVALMRASFRDGENRATARDRLLLSIAARFA